MAYTMTIVEVEGGGRHVLPADTVTLEQDGTAHAPLLPLGYRRRGDVFWVRSERWPELAGKALRLGMA